MSDVAGSGAGSGRPDPAAANTPAEFVEALRLLKCWRGLGYRQLEKRAAAVGESLPRSTLTAALTRDTLPREDLVVALVRTCGCNDGEVRQWVDARRCIAATRPEGVGAAPVPVVGATEIVARDGSNVAPLATGAWFIGQVSQPVRILFATLAGVGVIIVLLAAVGTIRNLADDPPPTPAPVYASYGANRAWTNTAHTRVGVDDREADGHGVYVEYLVGGAVRTLADINDSEPGHSAEAAGGVVARLRVCEQDEGCGDWVEVP